MSKTQLSTNEVQRGLCYEGSVVKAGFVAFASKDGIPIKVDPLSNGPPFLDIK